MTVVQPSPTFVFERHLYPLVFDAAHESLTYLLPKIGDPDRRGGFLCLLSLDIPHAPILTAVIGSVPCGKAAKYFELCQEKAGRLSCHSEHLSSWQSRAEPRLPMVSTGDKLGKWGGAIRCGAHRLILSFSGLPELADAALCLNVAIRRGWLDVVKAYEISRISSNPFAFADVAV